MLSAKNGVVNLYGNVDSYFEKVQADDVAAAVRGVVAVNNRLTVEVDYEPLVSDPYVDDWYAYDYGWYRYTPGYSVKSDAEILDDVEDELWWSPFVDEDDVTVTVDNGVVTLEGTVDSWAERSAARDNAYEGGAMWVDNELKVEVG